MTPIRLGPTRLRILRLVVEGRQRNTFLTVREMAQRLNCHFSNVHTHLKALERVGLVRREGTRATTTDYVFVPATDL